jgi:hypothetical protein
MSNLDVKVDQKMDQRTIVAYLALKRLSAHAIHKDLMATLRRDAMAYSTIAHYLHEAHCSHSSQRTTSIEVSKALDDSNEVILSSLDENPFASVRQLSRFTHIPPMTVYRSLTNSLRFTVRHLRWIPHALSHAQKKQRVELSRQLLWKLRIQCDRVWHNLVTLDESWFYLTTDHEFIWLLEAGELSERERRTIQSKSSCSQSFGIRTGFIWLTFVQRGTNSTALIISLKFYYYYLNGIQPKPGNAKEDWWLCTSIMSDLTWCGKRLTIWSRMG